MIEVTLLGTGSPIPDARRAGPSTLVRAGSQTFLIDCGRGVQQRMTGAGVGANGLTALLLTHLHSDHIADLGDLIITRWVTTFTPEPNPLRIIGPPGTAEVVDATLEAFRFDIGYRIAHHADLTGPPRRGGGTCRRAGMERGRRANHRGAHRSSAGGADDRFRVAYEGATVVLAGDTVPCASLDELAEGAGALVHTVIRKDLVEKMPMQRIRDICDYHSSVEQAAATAARAGVGILILTHYVPAIVPGDEDDWRALAASEFEQQIELGDDLHRVEVHPGVCAKLAN